MKQALQIAIDYMNDRLEDHDCKYQRHPATEAERINILADIETVKEALAKQEKQVVSLQCAHCQVTIETLNDKVMSLLAKQERGEPVETDWERIARVQNAKLMAMCGEAGGFEKLCEVMDKYEATTPQQRTWVGLTTEDMATCIDEPAWDLILRKAEQILKEKNGA